MDKLTEILPQMRIKEKTKKVLLEKANAADRKLVDFIRVKILDKVASGEIVIK